MTNEILQKENKEATILEQKQIEIIIPQCCREGWDSCPHATKRIRPKKRNIGL